MEPLTFRWKTIAKAEAKSDFFCFHNQNFQFENFCLEHCCEDDDDSLQVITF